MKTFRRFLTLALYALPIYFFMALPAFAEEGAKADPSESPLGLLFRWLNFAIVFGGIGFLIVNHGGSFFRANAKEISASIVEATAVKAEADRELREVESKVQHLDRDVVELREQARQNWATEAERLRTTSVAEIEKIHQAARGELVASERAAHQELRKIAAAISVERAAAIVSSRMNPEIRAKMFQSFLDQLGKGAN